MRNTIIAATIVLLACAAGAQQAPDTSRTASAASSLNGAPNLPVQKIGHDDLIGITVYDSPELTRSVRVSPEGYIRLPMVRDRINVAGLFPEQVESAIEKVLTEEQILVDPIVTVSVIEYCSRPITVIGAVKAPLTFQATSPVTLLDAISRAAGLTDTAGSEILVSQTSTDTDGKPATAVKRIPVLALIDGSNPELNLHLEGGDEVRVPEAGRVYVLGNVKKPCSYPIQDGSESSVLKALALSEGLESFPSHTAYIYRAQAGSTNRSEIPFSLQNILSRKTPDVMLQANDILYIPGATGLRAGVRVLEGAVGLGATLGSAALYVYH